MKSENKASGKPGVVVIGRNFDALLCMTRSLGEAGYPVEMLRVFQKRSRYLFVLQRLNPEAYSKYVTAYQTCVAEGSDRRIVESLIAMAEPGAKKLLFPADDYVAGIADAYMEVLRPYYELPSIGGRAGEITRMMQKAVQKQLAMQVGLPVVNGRSIRAVKGQFEIPEGVKYPCFVKPNVSRNSAKANMRRCADEQELRDVLAEFSQNADIEMLVEDYVEIRKELSVLGLSTGTGVIASGLFVQEKGGSKERRGVAVTGRMLPCAQVQELADGIVRLVKLLNYEGLFNVDLCEAADGAVYFVELNLRYSSSGYAATACGLNLPAMFADYMFFGKAVDLDCTVPQTDRCFLNERILLEEYSRNTFGMAEVRRMMRDADISLIRNACDKRPGRQFWKFVLFSAMLRLYYRLRSGK